MKIVRIRLPGDEIAYGVVEAEGIRVHQGTPFVAWEPTETVVPFDVVQLLAPVFPTKVVCVGRNYVDHAAERGESVPDEPVIFLKPATAVIGPGAPIIIPSEAREVHHEAELAIVVGTVSRRVAAEDASRHIIGYTAANDVSARDLQKKDGQWTRAKGFDTFLSARTRHRDRGRSDRPPHHLLGERRVAAGCVHRRHGVRCRRDLRFRHTSDDLAPR